MSTPNQTIRIGSCACSKDEAALSDDVKPLLVTATAPALAISHPIAYAYNLFEGYRISFSIIRLQNLHRKLHLMVIREICIIYRRNNVHLRPAGIVCILAGELNRRAGDTASLTPLHCSCCHNFALIQKFAASLTASSLPPPNSLRKSFHGVKQDLLLSRYLFVLIIISILSISLIFSKFLVTSRPRIKLPCTLSIL